MCQILCFDIFGTRSILNIFVDFLITEFGDYEGALQHFGLHIWCWITKYPPIANTFTLKCIFCKHISYKLEQFHQHLIETHVEQFYKVSTRYKLQE